MTIKQVLQMRRAPIVSATIVVSLLLGWLTSQASAVAPPSVRPPARLSVPPARAEPLAQSGTRKTAKPKPPFAEAPERRCDPEYCPSVPLFYKGGIVQHSPKVHIIFWGSKWKNGGILNNNPERESIELLFNKISGSKWQEVMTQYFDTTANVSLTMTPDNWIDASVTAPTLVSDAKIQEEVAKGVKEMGWKRENDAQFVVIPAPGSTYESGITGGCAYHWVDKSGSPYDFVPWARDEPFWERCKNYDKEIIKSPSRVTLMLASHEYAEAVTDPFPYSGAAAWQDTEGFENADICSTKVESIITWPPLGSVAGQSTWDNYAFECRNEDVGVPHVYAETKAATEATTTELTLNGTANMEGVEGNTYFKWGTIPIIFSEKTPEVAAGSTHAMKEMNATLTKLASGKTYYFRACAVNGTGTFCSGEKTGKTK
jgi:hypothetical protein